MRIENHKNEIIYLYVAVGHLTFIFLNYYYTSYTYIVLYCTVICGCTWHKIPLSRRTLFVFTNIMIFLIVVFIPINYLRVTSYSQPSGIRVSVTVFSSRVFATILVGDPSIGRNHYTFNNFLLIFLFLYFVWKWLPEMYLWCIKN